MPREYGPTNAAPYASAPTVGPAGDTYWNTAQKVLYVSDGTAWVAAGPGAAGAAGGDLAGSTYPNPVIAANAVTTTKCVAGLAVKQRQAITMLGTGNVPAGSPVSLAATPAMTIRANATVLFVIQPIGHMQVTTGGVTVRFRMRVEESGLTVVQWDALINVPAAACPFNTTQVPLTSLYTSAGGSKTYTLFAEMQTTGGQWVLSGGTFTVAELL
jgi:hypothetical protein